MNSASQPEPGPVAPWVIDEHRELLAAGLLRDHGSLDAELRALAP